MDPFIAPPSAPVLWAVAALAIGAIVWALLRRLLKLAVMLVVGVVCLYAFFRVTGTEPPASLEDARRDVQDGIREGARRGAAAATEGVRDLGEDLEDAAGRAIRDTLEDDARD